MKNEPTDFTPSELNRDELLIFNTMCFLHDNVENKDDLAEFISAFETDKEARETLTSVLVDDANKGFQQIFTTPPREEHN